MADGRGAYFVRMIDGTYQGMYGERSRLVRNPDGTWTATVPQDGTQYRFTPLAGGVAGKLTQIVDPNGNATVLAYDASGRLATVTDPVGRTLSFTYNAQNHITAVTDPANRVFTYSYDFFDSLIAVGYSDQTVTTFQYQSPVNPHLLTSIRDGQNLLRAQWVYDSQGRAIESSIDGVNGKVSLSYISSNQTVLTNARGDQTTYTYATLGGVHRVTQIAGAGCATCPGTAFKDYFYDSFGRNNAVNDRNNIRAYTYNYDETRGNVISRQDAAGTPLQRETFYTYHPTVDLVTAVTDPKGGVTSLIYNSATRNLEQVRDPLQNPTNFTYDPQGRLVTMTDAQSHVTTLTYDAWGNVATMTDAQNHVTAFTYDILGNLLTATDAAGRITQYTYDAMNRLKTVTDPLTGITRYDYDASGRLVQLTDAKNQITTFAYDSAHRLGQITAPGNRITAYVYDTEGNLVSRTDANTQTTTFTYDSRNRLTQKSYPGGATETFTYDGNSNLLTAGNAAISYTYTYDVLNRMTAATDSLGRALSYGYDANDNRTTLTAPGGDVTNYTYTAANQLWTMGPPPSGPSTTFTYDSLHRLSQKVLPNGTKTLPTYDTLSQLLNLAHTTSTSQPLVSTGYTYDVLGNRVTRTDTPSLTPPPATTSAATWSYDVANRLLTRPGVTYTYDNNGNTITKTDASGTTTYTYDFENRLISATMPGGIVASYAYDPFGRRISKTVNGVTTRYLYDGMDIIKEYDGTGALLATYRHGPGIDEPVAMTRGGQTVYYHADGLGSVTGLTNSSQVVVESYGYDGFGNLNQAPTVQNPYTYTGREWDAETGLYYYRARYYDPKVGRFLQQDPVLQPTPKGKNLQNPISKLLTRPQELQPYVYTLNNPVNYIDPKGESVLAAVVAALVGVVVTGEIIIVTMKCLKDCGEANNCKDPTDPNRGANINKCLDTCIPFLKFLGWTSRAGLLNKAGQFLGGAASGAGSN